MRKQLKIKSFEVQLVHFHFNFFLRFNFLLALSRRPRSLARIIIITMIIFFVVICVMIFFCNLWLVYLLHQKRKTRNRAIQFACQTADFPTNQVCGRSYVRQRKSKNTRAKCAWFMSSRRPSLWRSCSRARGSDRFEVAARIGSRNKTCLCHRPVDERRCSSTLLSTSIRSTTSFSYDDHHDYDHDHLLVHLVQLTYITWLMMNDACEPFRWFVVRLTIFFYSGQHFQLISNCCNFHFNLFSIKNVFFRSFLLPLKRQHWKYLVIFRI